MKLLESLVGRGSEQSAEKQLILEALLPQKESMLRLAKQALADSESKNTALASDILRSMSWWP